MPAQQRRSPITHPPRRRGMEARPSERGMTHRTPHPAAAPGLPARRPAPPACRLLGPAWGLSPSRTSRVAQNLAECVRICSNIYGAQSVFSHCMVVIRGGTEIPGLSQFNVHPYAACPENRHSSCSPSGKLEGFALYTQPSLNWRNPAIASDGGGSSPQGSAEMC